MDWWHLGADELASSCQSCGLTSVLGYDCCNEFSLTAAGAFVPQRPTDALHSWPSQRPQPKFVKLNNTNNIEYWYKQLALRFCCYYSHCCTSFSYYVYYYVLLFALVFFVFVFFFFFFFFSSFSSSSFSSFSSSFSSCTRRYCTRFLCRRR